LFDIDGLMNNLDMISDNSSSSKISRLSSDFEDVTIEYEGKRYTAQ